MAVNDLNERLDAAMRNPRLLHAALALRRSQLREAETLLKPYVAENPFDVVAIRMLAELAVRVNRPGDAEKLLRRALELAPNFHAARVNLAAVLYGTNRSPAAMEELGLLDVDRAENPNLHAAILNRLGEFEQALAIYRDALARHPAQPKVWLAYGHVLKTIGRRTDAVTAYRRAIAIQPGLGEAWWSLANLKTERFTEEDVVTMEALLDQASTGSDDRFHLEFALGKAFEDKNIPERAFAYYRDANAHRRLLIHYDAAQTTRRVDRMAETFTSAFRSGFHRWPSPVRLHARRADPRQPQPSRGDYRTARHTRTVARLG